MFKLKFASLIYALKIATCNCQYDKTLGFNHPKTHHKIQKVGKLDAKIDESSGLSKALQGGYWTHNDSGGEARIFRINHSGKILEELDIPAAKNKDWEDITTNSSGDVYIGDFGNNGNARKHLKVYKYTAKGTEEIPFRYADQKEYPPEARNFDCEAFFWFKGQLHLFTKSRVKESLLCKHYVLQDKGQMQSISPSDSIVLKQQVTAADVSPDGTRFALLTYGKLLVFGIENETINFDKPLFCIKTKRKQTESLAFESDNSLLFGNEQRDLYRLVLREK
ncbi:hypothetical protein LAG90_05465 [Marinilongibacter aquaticus]|uniref:hypothetical protein n=1 Tax=Marinilongibacter aquaticus TaxID=2975157 RepID=UPI0021BDA602|nr:hypothetical protein [Marinilongibacter aquaticus]UBM60088.1 hypothetical protein LAG90_05465 [Marinilongibacter aquaticus]